MQVFLGILVHMHCMGAHGFAVYSSERTYVRASDIAGLQRAVLDSVGEFQTLIHCMGAHGFAVYSSERTYVRASDIAGLQRAVLDSVGEFQTLIHDNFSCMYNLHVHVPLSLTNTCMGTICGRHPMSTNAEGANQHLMQLSQEVYYSTGSY